MYMATCQNPPSSIYVDGPMQSRETLIYKWRTIGALPKNEAPNAYI